MPVSLFNEKICSCCGKTFTVSDPTQWKLKMKINNKPAVFCSWSCMEKARKKKEETDGRKKTQDNDRMPGR